jgi:hypothetical protein
MEPPDAAAGALRWIAAQSAPADGGIGWPERTGDDQEFADDLYSGTAGILLALAEARLAGIGEFDGLAAAAAGRLQAVALRDLAGLRERARAGGDGPLGRAGDFGLYTGLAGHATARRQRPPRPAAGCSG